MADNQRGVRKRQNNCEKSVENIWKCRFFAVTLHPLSALKYGRRERLGQGSEKFFEKSFQKIWWIKKLALPLHHFRADKTAEVQKSKERAARLYQIDAFFEVLEQLNKFSFTSQEVIFQNNTFEIRAKI